MGTLSSSALLATVLTAVASVGVYFYQKLKKEKIPTKWEEVGKVKKIHLYPLKSGHRIELQKADCTSFGLKQTDDDEKVFQLRDRGFIVYGTKDKEFRTGHIYPNMVLIDVSVHDSDHIAIDAPTMRTLYVKIPSRDDVNTETKFTLHNKDEVATIDCGDEAATWFSRYILQKEEGLRLGYNDGHKRRNSTESQKSAIEYYLNLGNDYLNLGTDNDDIDNELTSVVLVNQASVTDLNKRMGHNTISVEYFRPNIVVDGPNMKPYAEDEWDWVKIGDAVFKNIKECTGCMLTTTDPDNASRNVDREPLKTLETYRVTNGNTHNEPFMGIDLGIRLPGKIAIGETVYFAKNEQKK